MTSLNPQLFTALVSVLLSAGHACAWDYSFGYKSVFDTNATQHIVGKQTVRQYSEWYHEPPISYWGPSANDEASTLTLRFDFCAPSAEIYLLAQLDSADNGFAHGSASLWASTNGTHWQLLLDSPAPPAGGFSQVYYHQDVPPSLLGGTAFWLQVRMHETGGLTDAPDPRATWAQAQFSRLDPANPTNVFQINVRYAPQLEDPSR